MSNVESARVLLGRGRVDLPGKPWFDVLAHICRNSDTTFKAESKIFSQNLLSNFFGPAGGSKVNRSYGKVK